LSFKLCVCLFFQVVYVRCYSHLPVKRLLGQTHSVHQFNYANLNNVGFPFQCLIPPYQRIFGYFRDPDITLSILIKTM
jgi:hypothetical protein